MSQGIIILRSSRTIRSPTFTYLFHKPAKEDRLCPGGLVEYDKLAKDLHGLQKLRGLLATQSDRTEDYRGPSMDVWREETAKLEGKIARCQSSSGWSGWLLELELVQWRIVENWTLWKTGESDDGTLRI